MVQNLAREYHYTPEQIGELTLGEIAALLEDDKGKSTLSDADIDAHGAWWGKLAAEEKLNLAERGW